MMGTGLNYYFVKSLFFSILFQVVVLQQLYRQRYANPGKSV